MRWAEPPPLVESRGVIDLGGKIQSPQWHAEHEPQPCHDAIAIADAHARLAQVQLEPSDILSCRVSGERLRNAANRLQL